ncbi:hypothetical protein [Actinoplanes sp. TFC3]|uniref:hypothetical protein n=1 Tax=Actinoplanes sp. TFC3 TaxID=1710355 RepID=UPI0008354F63|nr:hypothetical protein [Actinoplanes sp. TFC3]
MRIALVGIDGTGKTTAARHLAQVPGVRVVHAIRAHDDPASPQATRSRHLAAASAIADQLGHAPLKVALLYLQLCQYAPAERQAFEQGCTTLIGDRHPLVDPLVYLPMFARVAEDTGTFGHVHEFWLRQSAEGSLTVRCWLRECAGDEDIEALGHRLLKLAALPADELFDELTGLFGVRLPDRIVYLTLPVEEALRRTRARSGHTELHETARRLGAVQAAYEKVLALFAGRVAVQRIDCFGLTPQALSRSILD